MKTALEIFEKARSDYAAAKAALLEAVAHGRDFAALREKELAACRYYSRAAALAGKVCGPRLNFYATLQKGPE
jgi:hypothetical protein